MKKHLPNLITCCNLLCGAAAVVYALQGCMLLAFCLILAGAFFDFFDGMTARALKVSGPLGIQMDSLADDITFGLAPAVLLYSFLKPVLGCYALIALIMAAFAAYRLAKFNIDERQTASFIGLATPANAMFWGGITCLPQEILTPTTAWVLTAVSLLSGCLMVCEIPFFSLKLKSLSWKESKIQYIFLIGSLVLTAVCIAEALHYEEVFIALFAGTAIIVWYFIMNIINNIYIKLLVLFIIFIPFGNINAEVIPEGYYSNANGLKDAQLKNALHTTVGNGIRYAYGTNQYHSTNKAGEWNKGDLKAYGTWQAFPQTDMTEDGTIWDMYSCCVRYYPNKRGESACSMNIEHCLPKSWWGGTVNDAYNDL